jgi:predicted MFS family arabinose efflux permease
MRETYAYAILMRKARKLSKETGEEHRCVLDTGRSPAEIFTTAIVRPTKMLLFSPIIFLLSLFMFLIYGYLYLLFTAIPPLYADTYGFSTGSVGLIYIGLGVGSCLGLVITYAVSDRFARHLASRAWGNPKPEFRLPLVIVASALVPAGLFMFGWTAEKRLHWVLPTIGTAIVSIGATLAFV